MISGDENIAHFAIFICTFGNRTHVIRKGVIKCILQRYLTVFHFHKITGFLIPKLMIWGLYKWHIFDVPKNNLRGTYRTVRACARRLNRVTPFYTGRRVSQYGFVNLSYTHDRIYTERQVPSGTSCPPAVIHVRWLKYKIAKLTMCKT